MYASFFGFEKVPFNGIPDSDEMVAHGSFERAHATLRDGVLQGSGVLLLCGEPGAGKTTLLQKLRVSLEADGFQVCLLSACVDAGKLAELGAGALGPLGGTPVPGSSNAARDRSDGSGTASRHSLVILADDAHLLSKDKLRFFSDLITRVATSQAPVQIVFAADSSLNAVLRRHGANAIAHSVQVRAALAPLEQDEVAQYVSTKLQVAGCHQHSLLDERVVVELARRSGGNPSRIDTLCGMVLLIAYDSGKKHVEPAMVAEAVRDLDGDAGERLERLETRANPTAAAEEVPAPAQITPRASAAGWRPAVDRVLGNINVRGLAPAAAGTARRALRMSGRSIRHTWRLLSRFPGARRRHHPEPAQASAVAAVLRTYERDWLPLKIGFVGLLFVVVVIVIAVGVAEDRAPVVTATAPPSPSLPDPSPVAAPAAPSPASFATEIHVLEQALAASKAEALARERVLTKQRAQIEELQHQTADLEARLATARAVAPTRLVLPEDTSPVAAFPADAAGGGHGDGPELALIPASTIEAPRSAIPAQPSRTAGAGPGVADRIPPASAAIEDGESAAASTSVVTASHEREVVTPFAPGPVQDEDDRIASLPDVTADASARFESGSAATTSSPTAGDPVLVSTTQGDDPRDRAGPQAVPPGAGIPLRTSGTDRPDDAETEPAAVEDWSNPAAAGVAAAAGDVQDVTVVEFSAVDAVPPESSRLRQPREESRTVAAGAGQAKPARPRGNTVKPVAARAAGAENRPVVTGNTPNAAVSVRLLDAAEHGDGRLVQDLLGAGASVNVQDEEGRTPLMLAAGRGHLEVARILLDRGAAIGAANTTLGTALAYAAWSGHWEVVSELLRRGSRTDSTNGEGWTPLMYAAINGHTQCVKELLDRGADVNARNREGRTALSAAVWNGHTRLARALLDRGANVNAKTQDGWTPLLGAAFNGDSAMVGLLLDRGADRSARTRTGMTAVAIARERGHDDIAQTLSRPRIGRQAS
jgi:ankyrin repeat protein/type II secretory pathway predicted ATPase ExeA